MVRQENVYDKKEKKMPPKKGIATKHTIYRKIRQDIITGQKKPGERLSVGNLKEEFGTSITPVRDALQMLNQEDLVTIKPRSGYYVTLVTLKELYDMLEMREILELAAAGMAAEKITPDQIKALESVHAGYTDENEDSYSRYIKENNRFHTLLAKASGNDELAGQIGRLHDRLARFVVIARYGSYMIDTHQRLIDRLKARDPAGAKKILKKEMDKAKIAIMEQVMRKEAGTWHLGVSNRL